MAVITFYDFMRKIKIIEKFTWGSKCLLAIGIMGVCCGQRCIQGSLSEYISICLSACMTTVFQTKTSRVLKIFKYVSRCHVPIDVISEWPLRDTWRRNKASKFNIYKKFTFLFSWILKKLSNIMISVTNQLFNANSNNKK